MPQSDLPKLVVLISGTGSNLKAILDACASGELPATVAAVISNKSDAYGLERARQAGVPAVVLEKSKEQDRRAYDAGLAETVAAYRPDWVVLAGWMRILTSAFLDRFPDRVINLHPALPGTFPGTHAIERAYEAWQNGEIEKTGVMVHLVPDEGVDVGPVLGFEEICFQSGESIEQFENRVHKLEHELLVRTIKTVLNTTPINRGQADTKEHEGKPL
ncbi:MAG: phosphoribosylglycinamide formyltransferase [Chloroflexi bacterium]|nr:phosphoribosylglycinamide formyltransferase [Chloroflexota bacterium]